MRSQAWAAIAAALICAIAAPALAEPAGGTIERIKVHGKSLEGNLEGDSPDREVIVYLPASYAKTSKKRYPVVYELHGYSIGTKFWTDVLKWPTPMDRAFGSGAAREMIIVAPDAQTLHNGSMYSNSVTIGDWESYIAKDLVAYVDSHYRTLARRESRGLTGHSMGGYGTIRVGLKHPEVFSALYIMSPCCMSPRPVSPNDAKLESLTPELAAKGDFGVRATLSVAAAWSPNPKAPPFYADLPTKGGQPQAMVTAKWAANAPLVYVHQYVPALKSFKAIGLEIGLQDPGLKDSQELDHILSDYGIAHVFETYEGTHTSKIPERWETKALPFFDKALAF
jgi:enterochelin esterase-like enzyme